MSDGRQDAPRGRVAERVRGATGPLIEFLHEEAAGGIVLLAATIAALIWANSAAGGAYVDLWEHDLEIGAGALAIHLDLRLWINDGLMALFFFVVGLEIKRELVVGELRDRRAAMLAASAAAGGVLAPTVIFLVITLGHDGAAGWAIPAATDTAFAIGVMALLGERITAPLRLLMLAIAIVDDIIAIAIIAIFYSQKLSLPWLAAALAVVGLVAAMRRLGVSRIAAYVPVAFALWITVHESGVHATIAGVVLALMTPARPVRGREVLQTLEHRLHPLSAFAVVPLFALANAGLDFGGGLLGDALTSRLTWAVVAGLAIGKLLGITGAMRIALRLGIGVLPAGVDRAQLWGIAALSGIGFTVSLLVADLAFDRAALIDGAKVGIYIGSLFSALLGVVIFVVLGRRRGGSPRAGGGGR